VNDASPLDVYVCPIQKNVIASVCSLKLLVALPSNKMCHS
jgi:hypothetical protein